MLDFNTNRDKDLYLLDIYSDRTNYGGNSETQLELKKTDTEPEEVFRKQFLIVIDCISGAPKQICEGLNRTCSDSIHVQRVRMRQFVQDQL